MYKCKLCVKVLPAKWHISCKPKTIYMERLLQRNMETCMKLLKWWTDVDGSVYYPHQQKNIPHMQRTKQRFFKLQSMSVEMNFPSKPKMFITHLQSIIVPTFGRFVACCHDQVFRIWTSDAATAKIRTAKIWLRGFNYGNEFHESHKNKSDDDK